MTNKYYWHSRISERKFRHIVRCFAEDKTAIETASETNLDRKSINNIFLRIRRRVLESSLKNRPHLSVKEFKTKNLYFAAESEGDCQKYSAKFKSSVLVVLFWNGLIRADIIYAESDETFEQIENLADLKDRRIVDFGLYDIIDNLSHLSHWDKRMFRYEYHENYSGNLLLYFLWRSKKFKGISREKFILHLRETEWRFNKIFKNEEMKQKVATDIDTCSLISKDMYNELLKLLRTTPL